MKIEEIISKTVTGIYMTMELDVDGYDKAECFLELDGQLIIDIPFGESKDVWVKELNKKASSLFSDLSDIPVYYVNKEGRTVGEVSKEYQNKKRNPFNRLRSALLGQEPVIKEYQPHIVEFRENKMKYIKDRKITDFLWYPDESEKGYLLLDNGYLFTETLLAFHGTGLAGLNYFDNIEVC